MKLSPVVLQQMLEGLLQHPGDSSASPLSKSTSSTDYLFSPTVSPLSFVVGLSGGVDSIVLLHALSILSQQASSESDKPETKPKLNFKLKAIHVNHQLQFEANEWQKFCVSFCETLNIPIQCFLVDAVPKQGEGPEAAARNARYDVFKKKLLPNEILLTAHHLDDQIETVLLQMLRGTGVDGGAGIRPVSKFNTSYLIRPLLMFSRDAIEAYANENSLTWISDPSNTETHYDRNYLRHDVLPAIEKRWPSYRDTIGRFSQHMRQASELLNDIAEQDLEVTNDKRNECLLISELNRLSLARKNNLIRHWLNSQNYSLPSDKQLKQINALIVAREDAVPVVSWGNVELRRFHGCLYSMNNKRKKIPEDFCENISEWKPGKRIEIPGYGFLELVSVENDGINETYFSSKNIQIKLRQGGEKCKPENRNKTQTLKKVLQEKNIPPWLRDELPIVFIDGEIATVVGAFDCSPFAVKEGPGIKVVCNRVY